MLDGLAMPQSFPLRTFSPSSSRASKFAATDQPGFPRGFVWGSATAATQIEGAATADGKGESNWDHFANQPGRIAGGDSPAVACDHYHRYRDDVRLMTHLGLRHYRFSVSWPRILPEGTKALNMRGLGFYDRLVDSLLASGVQPWVTLFHWDLPQVLEATGGWRRRETAEAFARYAEVVVRALGDRVKHWITLNEIGCFTRMAYGGSLRPPALNEPEKVINQAYHHALLAHGYAVQAVREHGGGGAQVGLTDDSRVPVPAIVTPENIAAARAAFIDANVRVLDPIFRGHYSADYHRVVGRDRAEVQPDDAKLISLRTDFLGLNIYTGHYVRARRRRRFEPVAMPSNYPRTDCNWLNLIPEALYWGPRLVHDIYRPKSIYITENGAGYNDPVTVTKDWPDLHRIAYARECLAALRRSIQGGAPVKGYFFWSFLDNFEWADGYQRRFGLVHVNFRTQCRTLKLSASWYRQVIATNAIA